MRFLSIDHVIPGARLARPLYDINGNILLREDYELTEGILDKLKDLGYSGLYIEDEISKGIVINDVVDEKLRLTTAARLEDILKSNASLAQMQPLISEIVDSIISNGEVIVSMNRLLGHHEYTYIHCVNVGILSVSIGVKYKMNRHELIQLGTAGILHDVGKKNIPLEILDKPGRLTDEEYEFMKRHAMLGYEMLLSCIELSSVTRVAVLEHHERCDGSGYPRGLKGNEITLFGKIVAVADTYDAMTTDRAYRNAFLPSEAVEYLMGSANRYYDLEVISNFMKCIAVYPVGTCVELSDGTKGIVMENYPDCILRPVVRNIENKAIIDLKNDNTYLNICILRTIK